jgi:hypothetical protein
LTHRNSGHSARNAGRFAASALSVMMTSAPASFNIYETSAGFRKLLMGTTTAPACNIPKSAGMNSGQFLSHKPTRSPGFTPMRLCKNPATRAVSSENSW